MLVLGLVLIVFGVLAVLAGLFTAGDRGEASLLGIHVGATSVFLVGLFAGLAILSGIWLTKRGTKRELRHRRDQRRLQELSAKLDEVEADRTQRHHEGSENEA
ncbi:hypothetical protein JCM18899A_09750 [Nocardioides sp. AN3]